MKSESPGRRARLRGNLCVPPILNLRCLQKILTQDPLPAPETSRTRARTALSTRRPVPRDFATTASASLAVSLLAKAALATPPYARPRPPPSQSFVLAEDIGMKRPVRNPYSTNILSTMPSQVPNTQRVTTHDLTPCATPELPHTPPCHPSRIHT